MQYTSDAPPVRSLDVEGTPTVNAGRYEDANCRLRLNSKGQPLAIRRVVSLGQPGSFATDRHQVVMPSGSDQQLVDGCPAGPNPIIPVCGTGALKQGSPTVSGGL